MIEVRNPAGRLITFMVCSPVDDGNAEAAALELRQSVRAISTKVLVVTDLSGARTLAPATAEQFVRVMKADNPRLERSAIMIGASSATFVMQVERMVREAQSDARRTFREETDLVGWLADLLTVEEEAAVRAFLRRAAGPSSPP